ATSSSAVPLPRPRSASEPRDSMWAWMQAAQTLGAGVAARAKPGGAFAGVGAPPVCPKTPPERHIERNTAPMREIYFITTFDFAFGSAEQSDSRLADQT